MPPCISHHIQTRRKQEIANASVVVEVHNLRQYGKRWVVHHSAPCWVSKRLVVAAGIERAHERGAVYAVFVCHPVGDRIVYIVGRVAVVCCLFRLELVEKVVVLVVAILALCAVALLAVEPVRFAVVKVKLQPGEVNALYFQRSDLLLQLAEVPRGQFSRAVMPYRVLLALGVGEVVKANARHFLHAQFFRRNLPPVALDDDVVLAPDTDGVVESVREDGLLYLVDVVRRVPARVLLVRR